MGGVYGRESKGGGGGEKVTYHSPKLTIIYELRGMSAENLADEVLVAKVLSDALKCHWAVVAAAREV